MRNLNEPFSTGIKRIIADRGLVQKAVAKRSGFSEQQFCNMIHNRKIIRACDLIPISKALGVKISEIYSADEFGLQQETDVTT